MDIKVQNTLIFLLSIFMLSTAPILAKMASMAPLPLLFWRLLLVSIILFLVFLVKRPIKLLAISFKEFKSISIISLFLVAHFYTWFRGVPLLSVAMSTMIYATNPIFIAILSHFILREPFHKKYALGLALSLFGIYLNVRHDISLQSYSLEGLAMLFSTAFFYSCYTTLSKKMRLTMANTSFNFYLNLIAALFALIILGLFSFLHNSNHATQWHLDWYNLKIVLGMVIFPSLLGHTLHIYSIASINLNWAGVMKLGSPLISSALAYLFLGEKPHSSYWWGLFFVASGMLAILPWDKWGRKENSTN